MLRTEVIIPFRDRGIDPRRGANIEIVLAWWWAFGFKPMIVDDGLTEGPFNRHRAYNRAVAKFPETDVFVFAEADMLVPRNQITAAVTMAFQSPGLVVPFTQYRYLSDASTTNLRDGFHDSNAKLLAEWWGAPLDSLMSIFNWNAESVMDDGKSIGALNVVSAKTLKLTGGFTEATKGNWYDDNIIEESFAFLTSPTRFVEGPAVHMYHLPGWKGAHLTPEDRTATAHNKALLQEVRRDIRRGDQLSVRRMLMAR